MEWGWDVWIGKSVAHVVVDGKESTAMAAGTLVQDSLGSLKQFVERLQRAYFRDESASALLGDV